jgi:hypothetical protein
MSDAAESIDVQESKAPEAANEQESNTLLNPQVEPEGEQSPEESAVPHLAGDPDAPTDEEIDWGERPEWMPQNFWNEKDGPDLEGLSKAYNELRSKMSAGKHKAPEDGKYDIGSLKDHGIAEDDELLGQFSSFAAENGLSQDQFDQITSMYMNQMSAMMDEVETNKETELAKLGPRADKVINSLNTWLGKMSTSGTLAAEEVDAITRAANNADFIKAMNKIRASYGEQTIPDVTVQEGSATTKADLDQMVADPRYGKDMAYTQSVERKFMEFFGEA